MIPEIVLQRACGSAALNRARMIVARKYVSERACQYHKGNTFIDAQVRSQSMSGIKYHSSAVIDEELGQIIDYDCTCPAAYDYSGSPCKHVAALILDFNNNPGVYAGYNSSHNASTTFCLADLMDRELSRPSGMASALSQQSAGEPAQGTLGLELTLVKDGADWSARFRIVGPHGAYVLKDIEGFTERLARKEYYSYGKNLAFTHEPEAFTPQAQQVIAFIQRAVSARVAGVSTSYRWSYQQPRISRDLHLSMIELADLVDLYAQEGFLLDDGSALNGKPRKMHVVDGDPDVGVEINPLTGGAYKLDRRGDARFADCAGTLFAWEGDTFYRCSAQLAKAADFLTSVYGSPVHELVVSKKDKSRFAASILPQLESALGTKAPEELAALEPVPCSLEFYLDRDRNGVTCSVKAVYGEHSYEVLDLKHSADGALNRDSVAEGQALRVLERYFPGVSTGECIDATYHAHIQADEDQAIARFAFEGTPELARLGQVFTTPAFDRVISTQKPSVSVGLSIKSDLINLSVSTSDLPQDELFALLGSYRAKRRYHRLRDGTFIDMQGLNLAEADDLVSELGITAHQLAKGEIELPSYRAFLLEDMVDDSEKDDSFEQYIDHFRSVDPNTYTVPESLQDILRPYQVTGYQWLSMLVDMGFGGILADEMGLGKSVQLISLLLSRREEARSTGPSLIVCPASLVYNWAAEFERFAPQMDVAVVSGIPSERQAAREDERHEVLITSYELLRRDIEDYAAMSFWSETLDEAQYIKNHITLAARSVKKVNAQHRFALTGTPVENRLSELWSIFDYLMPGLLGPYKRFKDRYEQPILSGDENAAERLRAAVRPFILRRLKADVLKDLPEKLETVVYAHLEGEQERLYAAHEQSLRLSLSKQTDTAFSTGKLAVLAELTKLRQICCDPSLLYEDYKGPSAKLDTIMDLIDSVIDSGQKTLVFSQFTSYLELIANRLIDKGVTFYRITGSTPKRTRLELVDQFNDDDTPVFLISLKAGGTGLNLTGASVVIHADPWWNAAAQNQATDRAHRIGQTHDVTVYKVIAKGTIEERIIRLQDAKSDLADSIMGAENTSIASLTKEDLIDLLS